jgi:hemerythrin-like domain-containing protein
MTDSAPDANHRPTPNSAVLDFAGIHGVMRGFLTKMDTALTGARGNAARVKKVADLMLFGVAGLRFHHHVEDNEYWPALVAKGADGALLQPLQAAHRELEELLDRLEPMVEHLRANPIDDDAFASVAELLPEFREHVRHHLDEEEPIMFPMLEQYISDPEAHAIAARVAKTAPKKGISWLMGGVTYSMTPAEAENFLGGFPKPIIWLRPMFLRTYRRNCSVLGITPDFPK